MIKKTIILNGAGKAYNKTNNCDIKGLLMLKRAGFGCDCEMKLFNVASLNAEPMLLVRVGDVKLEQKGIADLERFKFSTGTAVDLAKPILVVVGFVSGGKLNIIAHGKSEAGVENFEDAFDDYSSAEVISDIESVVDSELEVQGRGERAEFIDENTASTQSDRENYAPAYQSEVEAQKRGEELATEDKKLGECETCPYKSAFFNENAGSGSAGTAYENNEANSPEGFRAEEAIGAIIGAQASSTNKMISDSERGFGEKAVAEGIASNEQGSTTRGFVGETDVKDGIDADARGDSSFVHSGQADKATGNFYMLIEPQLSELFARFPRDKELEALLEGSEWVRVNYGGAADHYVVGKLKDGPVITHICYGVPSSRRESPPKQMQGFCQWLPTNPKAPDTTGYWMMYQDALSGNNIAFEVV